MTTEDDFQAALDANPDDWQTRLVFADWLQERDDLRAEGYRALGVRRLKPDRFGTEHQGFHAEDAPAAPKCSLPRDWWELLLDVARIPPHHERTQTRIEKLGIRRMAEDAAALAFAKLPAARRVELLAHNPHGGSGDGEPE